MPSGLIHPEGLIGASSGIFWQEPDLLVRTEKALEVSSRVLEISSLRLHELSGTLELLSHRSPALAGLEHLSLHAPADVGWSEDLLGSELRRMRPLVDVIIIHPTSLEGPLSYELVRDLGEGAVIENMDIRRQGFQFADELGEIFDQLPEAGFCLDVAHVLTIDPTMEMAFELLDAFGGRLRELHVSGITANGQHIDLDPPTLAAFGPVLADARVTRVPWVLESLLV